MTLDAIFDTQIDTRKFSVAMKTSFKLRNDVVTKDGTSPIYLFIQGDRPPKNLHLHCKKKNWNEKDQRAKPIDREHEDLNLVLDHIQTKISEIKIRYRLQNMILTPAILKDELDEGNHRVLFVSYMRKKIADDKSLSKGTARRYHSVANNIEKYKKDLHFTDITESFVTKYRYYMYDKGKKATTINSNIIAFKHYLKLAKKDSINIQVDLEDIEGGKTTGNRTSLTPAEVRTMCRYYFHTTIEPNKKLALGYFLFSCMTGLRISDVQRIDRSQLYSTDFAFANFKTEKDQTIALNKMARKIVEFLPALFVKKLTEPTLNWYIKRAAKSNKVTKHVTFHVARHTFATNFLRMGGKVENLQKLLGHSKIETTMIYVHILAHEANAEIHKLDGLFEDFGFNLDIE